MLKDEPLTKIVKQNSTKISLGKSAVAYDLWYETFTKLKFDDYAKKANNVEKSLKGLSVKQREDAYWENMSNRNTKKMPKFVPDYAIDNDFSLFPESYTHWNLSKFTDLQSIIHMVCVSQCFITFSQFYFRSFFRNKLFLF